MESALRNLKDEIEEKQNIVIEQVETEIPEVELETLKEEFIKKYDTNQEEEKEDDSNANADILKLFKAGYSEVEIAKKLGKGLGEIKLVLGLFNK
jgi:DNA-binding NarL/FixJ family response regulator